MSKQHKNSGYFTQNRLVGIKELLEEYGKAFPDDYEATIFWYDYGVLMGLLNASTTSEQAGNLLGRVFSTIVKASAWTAVSKKGSFKVEQKKKLNLAKEVPLSNAREDDKDRDYMG